MPRDVDVFFQKQGIGNSDEEKSRREEEPTGTFQEGRAAFLSES